MPFTGFQDFNPDFGSALQRMIAARPGLSITSGYRDPARQAMLYDRALKKYGSPAAARKWVAPPGHSYHNKRLAADLGFASPEDIKWAHANAANYGLKFPLGNENWHVELASTRGAGEGGGGGGGVNVPVESSLSLVDAGPVSAPADLPTLFADSVAAPPSAGPVRPTTLLRSQPVADTPELEVASATPETPQSLPSDSAAIGELGPLASLFKLPEIGKAGLKARRPPYGLPPTIGYG